MKVAPSLTLTRSKLTPRLSLELNLHTHHQSLPQDVISKDSLKNQGRVGVTGHFGEPLRTLTSASRGDPLLIINTDHRRLFLSAINL
jgi:hypothetical protein